MKKVKIGVLGAYRGTSMINYCKRSDNAEVVAICDKSPEALETQRQFAEGMDIAFYDNFEDFIQHDMDDTGGERNAGRTVSGREILPDVQEDLQQTLCHGLLFGVLCQKVAALCLWSGRSARICDGARNLCGTATAEQLFHQ